MKISARNFYKGTVTKITLGVVNAEITLEIGGGLEIVSHISLGSVERLGLAVGKPAYAAVKVDSVLLAVDD